MPVRSDIRPDRALEALAAQQPNVVSRWQLIDCGLSPSAVKRRVASGRLLVVLPGVFRTATSVPSKEQGAMAACLWAGPGALVSHRAAGVFWELDGVSARHMEITVPMERRIRSPKLVVHHAAELIPADRGAVGAIPVTSPLRTLIDLAGCIDVDALELAVEDAFRRGLTRPRQLAWRLEGLGGKGRSGCADLRSLLEGRSGATDSGWEVRLERILVRAGLPRPRRQYEIRVDGKLVARADLAYPSYRIAIEYDGVRWHTGRVQLERGSAREIKLATLGWQVLHVTKTTMVDAPGAVLALLSGRGG
jgi:very-short-patch-repair endonuclease